MTQQINITLGTAGHIDHGKTALVKCLTGCDTDRLKEEKERGMSIDLGFAPCAIAGTEVGIVDVPGHENFIKTMVAGATAMDAVMLVVAADDGVMPQTREHLEILTLLGIRHGLVVLTKIDRVTPEHLEIVRADLDDFLRGTFLEGAPVVPVSNITGQGFDQFFETLDALVREIRPKRIDGLFRLPVDRAFSAKGFGTVIAGVPVSGSGRVGDEVVLLPQGLTGQIRQIEVYGRASDQVMAGQCAALNIRHWDHHGIHRGDVLTVPGYFEPQEWFIARLRLLPREKLVLKNGAQVKFHTGTSEVPAVVYAMQGNALAGGGEYLIQVHTSHPIAAGPGDPFILRMLSPVQTIGGGAIVEGTSRRLKRNRPEIEEDLRRRAEAVADERRFVEFCVRHAESLAASLNDLAKHTKIPRTRLQLILGDLSREAKILSLSSDLYLHPDAAAEAGKRVLDSVNGFHRQSPSSPGMTPEQLRQSSPIDPAVLDKVVALLEADGRLVRRNQRLAAAGHQVTYTDEDARYLDAVETVFRTELFHPPSPEELAERIDAPPATVQRILKILREHQRLVRLPDGLVFHQEAVDRAREILVDFLRREGRLESVRFKYLLDTTRKFALPLLDYFDQVGVTRRDGNTRYLKTPPK